MSSPSKSIFTPGELALLGLDTYRPAELATLNWRHPAPAEALGAREAIGLAALVAQFAAGPTPTFEPARHEFLQDIRLEIERGTSHRDVVRFRGLDSRPRVLSPTAGALESPEPLQGGRTVYVDMREHPRLVVQLGDSVVAVEATHSELTLQALEGLAVPALSAVRAPLHEWAASCNDSWLAKELDRHGEFADAWHSAIGAGLACRLIEPATVRVNDEGSSKLVPNPLVGRVRDWLSSRSTEDYATFLRLALAEVDRTLSRGSELEEDAATAPEERRNLWLALFRTRDDIESLRIVLAFRRCHERLDEALGPLDRQGASWRWMVPTEHLRADERLRRVARNDPGAWWGALAPDEAAP